MLRAFLSPLKALCVPDATTLAVDQFCDTSLAIVSASIPVIVHSYDHSDASDDFTTLNISAYNGLFCDTVYPRTINRRPIQAKSAILSEAHQRH